MKTEEKIHKCAFELGFRLFGITDTRVDEEQCLFFDRWLEEGKSADMGDWLERGRDKRCDLNNILPGVKSVIVVGINYYPGEHDEVKGKVARYAWGDDYHEVMGEKLKKLSEFLGELGDPDAKWYVDTGAIFERYFAVKAGLGFIGKNTCLITPEFGSWVFLGVVLTRLELVGGEQLRVSGCGDCRKCIEACPTGALSEKCVDARKCISYLTIERRGEFTKKETVMVSGQDFCFGCDVCQEVCPHNCRKRLAEVKRQKLCSNLRLEDIPKDEESFREKFKKSPIKRAKLAGILRNLRVTLPRK